jgi:hypothetical protein
LNISFFQILRWFAVIKDFNKLAQNRQESGTIKLKLNKNMDKLISEDVQVEQKLKGFDQGVRLFLIKKFGVNSNNGDNITFNLADEEKLVVTLAPDLTPDKVGLADYVATLENAGFLFLDRDGQKIRELHQIGAKVFEDKGRGEVGLVGKDLEEAKNVIHNVIKRVNGVTQAS